MLSPASSLALSNSMCCTVPNVTVVQAALLSGAPLGTFTTRLAGALTRSAAMPSTWKPMIERLFSHKFSRPCLQRLQVPQNRPG